MNNLESNNSVNEARIKVQQLNVQDLLDMPKEERAQFLSKFEGLYEFLSMAQVQEFWKRRDELDEEMFQLMISSVIDPFSESNEKDICPFTGLQADTTVSGGYGSRWIDSLDGSILCINHSVVKDLVNLAQRTGAGIEEMTITKLFPESQTLFDHSVSAHGSEDIAFEMTNKVGALNEEDLGVDYNFENEMKNWETYGSAGDRINLTYRTQEDVRVFHIQTVDEARSRVSETLTE